ncbi:YdeI/OmpD-associated family protein [Sinorhizobium numidicum]|uniref:YdeI/OmpD-associated family protein n=1 Tax=Sinorhizobium numidicum TaxID=680248 RepID=A0ABY8D275_9HYPH|nr:YdeI/OmpD-associated family protein [Sinorhizobium numidicum]WEX78325.1 YdeI/OmpD-associated family protein [Sinorhizobium numidicum]WEX84984.1 YdeI/OmpD-associated family protein [Sinorhizobium numidicum]
MTGGTSNLKRAIHPMPDDIASRLRDSGLEAAYAARPAYQRNDYLGWISRAKHEETRERRMAQMLAELKAGDTYMRMPYRGRSGAK